MYAHRQPQLSTRVVWQNRDSNHCFESPSAVYSDDNPRPDYIRTRCARPSRKKLLAFAAVMRSALAERKSSLSIVSPFLSPLFFSLFQYIRSANYTRAHWFPPRSYILAPLALCSPEATNLPPPSLFFWARGSMCVCVHVYSMSAGRILCMLGARASRRFPVSLYERARASRLNRFGRTAGRTESEPTCRGDIRNPGRARSSERGNESGGDREKGWHAAFVP